MIEICTRHLWTVTDSNRTTNLRALVGTATKKQTLRQRAEPGVQHCELVGSARQWGRRLFPVQGPSPSSTRPWCSAKSEKSFLFMVSSGNRCRRQDAATQVSF